MWARMGFGGGRGENTNVVAVFAPEWKAVQNIRGDEVWSIAVWHIFRRCSLYRGARGSRLAAVSSTSGIAETTNGPWSRIALIYITLPSRWCLGSYM